MKDYLADMVARRRKRIAEEFGSLAPSDLERLVCAAEPPKEFGAALRDRADVAIIAEVKKRSPAAGAISPLCEASKQALRYQDGGAAAVSVLTEPEDFGGSLGDLSDVADALDVPVLCKDFVVDPAQIALARSHGADAVLLMVSVLGDQVAEYIDLAGTFRMTPLVEVIDERELAVARRAGAQCIVGNSRDLRTLQVDTERALAIVTSAAQAGLTVIAASGIESRGGVEKAAAAGAHAVLVGSSLMRAEFPEDAVEDLTGVAAATRHQI